MDRYIITRITYNGRKLVFGGYYRNGALDRLSLCDDPDVSGTGNIFMGTVTEVKKNIGGAFADIGNKKIFIPEKGLKRGQELPVMIMDCERGTKLARGTTKLCFSGRYCIIRMPGNGRISYSKNIEGNRKNELSALIDTESIKDADVTVRTNAMYCPEELPAEIEKLLETASDVIKKSKTCASHSLLYRDDPLYIKDLMSLPADRELRITSDDEEITGELKERGIEAEYYNDTYPLRSLFNIERDLERIASNKVYLNCGGYIVIEKTEAFTSIDVNTGKCGKGSDPEETYYKVNVEAAYESARQIRLRNLSGIIMIDFINLKDRKLLSGLIGIMNKALSEDSNKGTAVDITPLGIMEITRARRGRTFDEIV